MRTDVILSVGAVVLMYNERRSNKQIKAEQGENGDIMMSMN